MRVLIKFYLSCILSAWVKFKTITNLIVLEGDRLWSFALSIYFITLNKDSLMMTAINGLSGSLAKVLFGPLIGSLIDKHPRFKVVRTALFIQNLTVAINCIIVVNILLFRHLTEEIWHGFFFYFIQGIMIFLNVISGLASMTTKIAIERDWVIVIAKNANDTLVIDKDKVDQTNDETNGRFKVMLANINASVRRFDLMTSIIAPMVAGAIMSFLRISPRFNGTIMSALFFAVWNIVSFFVEYNLLSSVYDDIPELQIGKEIEKNSSGNQKKFCVQIKKIFLNTFNGWKAYFSQGLVLMPSIALSLLYLTVLSFDSITIGYAKSQKLTEQFISLLQSAGSISGVLGTIAFQIMHNRLKIFLPYIGIFGCTYQLVFLFVCFTAIWLPGTVFVLANQNTTTECLYLNETLSGFINSTEIKQLSSVERFFYESPCRDYTSIIVLLGGMALSRFGLWLSDLVIHQIIQENVEENQRGIIGGAQNSFNTIFDLIKYCLVIVLSDVTQYGFLVIISVIAVFSSAMLYIVYAIIEVINKRFYQSPENDEEIVYNKSMIQIVRPQAPTPAEVVNNNEDDEDF